MDLFIEGQVTLVMPEKSGVSASNKEWKSQQFILQTDGQYPKEVLFKLFGDKVGLVKKNEYKRIFFNSESKKWKDNYFTDLNVWKVETCGTVITDNRTSEQLKSDNDKAPVSDIMSESRKPSDDLSF
jgi:hypothetical protein